MKNQTYIEVDIPINGFQGDILSGVLHSAGCLGILELNSNLWRIYFDEHWTPDVAKNLFQTLKHLNREFDNKNIVMSRLPFQDWNAEWKKYFKPIEPAKGIWVRPPWEKFPLGAEGIEIIINPQMGFGTGHHETTVLMIKLMQGISFKGKSVLDVGTGSGILSILASKLGAEYVMAIDNDPDAIANAEENTRLNRTNNVKVEYMPVESLAESQFSVVLANIDYKALSSFAQNLIDLIENKGKIITSGILTDEAPQIESLYRNEGLTLLRQENINEWAALIWENHS